MLGRYFLPGPGSLTNMHKMHMLKATFATYQVSTSGATFNVMYENDDVVILSRPVTTFQMNQSLVGCKRTGEAAIVDAGGRPAPFMEAAERKGLQIWHLLQTHAHIDHVSGLKATKEALPAALVYLHPLDLPVYESVPQQSQMFGVDCELPLPDIDKDLVNGATVSVGEIDLEVVLTPGHSPGKLFFVLFLVSAVFFFLQRFGQSCSLCIL